MSFIHGPQAQDSSQDEEILEAPDSPISDPESQGSRQEVSCPQNDHENEITEDNIREINDTEHSTNQHCFELQNLGEENDPESAVNENSIGPYSEVNTHKINQMSRKILVLIHKTGII